MKKLLHIMASPREDESRTHKVSVFFLDSFKQSHADWIVEEINVFKENLPSLSVKKIDGKYMLLNGIELYGEYRQAWEEVIVQINRFLSADGYLISTPMWNFSIPYPLKHYIDVIIQPKFLFNYTTEGKPEGLVKNKKMVIIATRGGDYSSQSAKETYDFQIPYLRTIFGFVGLTDIKCIIAEPMDALGPDTASTKIIQAQQIAGEIAKNYF